MDLSLKDIAARAGLSQATVSRVINGSRGVREDNRRRVQEVLSGNRYVPDLRAVGLARGKAAPPLLALSLPGDLTPHFLSVLAGVRDALAGTDVQLVLRDARPSSGEWKRSLMSSGPAGVLILGRGLEEGELDYYRAHGIPYLLLNWAGGEGPSLSMDDRSGGRIAAEWLWERGSRRPWYLGSSTDPDSSDRERWEGFRSSFAERGIQASRHGIPLDGSSAGFMAGGARALAELPWADAEFSPDGLFFYCDEMALGAWPLLRSEHPGIPAIGYDGWEPALALGIASVAQPSRRMGHDGARILLDMMGGWPFPSGLEPYRPSLA